MRKTSPGEKLRLNLKSPREVGAMVIALGRGERTQLCLPPPTTNRWWLVQHVTVSVPWFLHL